MLGVISRCYLHDQLDDHGFDNMSIEGSHDVMNTSYSRNMSVSQLHEMGVLQGHPSIMRLYDAIDT